MNNNYSHNSSSGGLGFLGVLQIIFIVLKCLDMIDWSWATVFIPMFIGIGLWIVMLITIAIIKRV